VRAGCLLGGQPQRKTRLRCLHGGTMEKPGKSIWSRYGYLWVTGALFAVSLAGHWLLAWSAYKQEQLQHNAAVEASGFLVEVGRDTLENWQSEFLQLMWQIAGLAILFHVRSPQSRENEARLEHKVDLVLRKLDPEGSEKEIAELDRDFVR
jgi:hypothetical protein